MRGVRLRVDVESRSLADRDRCRGTFKDHARDPIQLYAALQSPPSCRGHLFQGRYKAILCDRDAYLWELVRFI